MADHRRRGRYRWYDYLVLAFLWSALVSCLVLFVSVLVHVLWVVVVRGL